MTRSGFDLSRHAPPGMELRFWTQLYWSLLAFAVLRSLFFLQDYQNCWQNLWEDPDHRYLRAGVMMEPFGTLMEGQLGLFWVLLLAMGIMAAVSYTYFHRGSKSIYLMRRLPDGGELHRRCLTLPLWGSTLCLVCALTVSLIYYAVYVLLTPPGCFPGGMM